MLLEGDLEMKVLLNLRRECFTELAKKVCPRLRELATAPAGGITHPMEHTFLANSVLVSLLNL